MIFSDDTELIDNVEEAEEIEEDQENEDIISTDQEQDPLPEVEDLEEIEQDISINDNLEHDIYDELSEGTEVSEELPTDYQQLIENTDTIISLLTVSEDNVYDSNYDTVLNSNVIQCFLLASVLGCFVCSALFRKW